MTKSYGEFFSERPSVETIASLYGQAALFLAEYSDLEHQYYLTSHCGIFDDMGLWKRVDCCGCEDEPSHIGASIRPS